MALLNEVTQELSVKIVYVGAKGSGKTTNLQSLFKQTSQNLSSRFFDLHNLPTSSSGFDFLPLDLGEVSGLKIKAHLFTLPDPSLWPHLSKTILLRMDGFVFVCDSRMSHFHSTEKCFHQWIDLLNAQNTLLKDLCGSFQYNHRDAEKAFPLHALKETFRSEQFHHQEAVAVQDIGVTESLEAVLDQLTEKFTGSVGSIAAHSLEPQMNNQRTNNLRKDYEFSQ